MQQQTGSKLGREYTKALYCHPTYITYKWTERKENKNEVAQSCLTLCDSMDYSLPSSSVHGIFQAIVLEWVAIAFSKKNIYFCFIDYAKPFDCGSQQTMENSSRDGNTRPPYLPSETSVCRSRSNS